MIIPKSVLLSFVDFTLRKQELFLEFFSCTSKHFAKKSLFGATITLEDYRRFFQKAFDMAAHVEDYKKLMRLMNLNDISLEFFVWLSGMSLRFRSHIVNVLMPMSPRKMAAVYKKLHPEWIEGVPDADAFLAKLQTGCFDHLSYELLAQLMTDSSTFASEASGISVSLDMVFKLEGLICIRTGSFCMAELVSNDLEIVEEGLATRIMSLMQAFVQSELRPSCKKELRSLYDKKEDIQRLNLVLDNALLSLSAIPGDFEMDKKNGLLVMDDRSTLGPMAAALLQREHSTPQTAGLDLKLIVGTTSDEGAPYAVVSLPPDSYLCYAFDLSSNSFSSMVNIEAGGMTAVEVRIQPSERMEFKNDEYTWESLCASHEWLAELPFFGYSFQFFDYSKEGSIFFWSKHLKLVCRKSDALLYSLVFREKQVVKVNDQEIAMYVIRPYSSQDKVLIDFINIKGGE